MRLWPSKLKCCPKRKQAAVAEVKELEEQSSSSRGQITRMGSELQQAHETTQDLWRTVKCKALQYSSGCIVFL